MIQFPRQINKKNGWTLEHAFIERVQKAMYDKPSEEYHSKEAIEEVLLAAEEEIEVLLVEPDNLLTFIENEQRLGTDISARLLFFAMGAAGIWED